MFVRELDVARGPMTLVLVAAALLASLAVGAVLAVTHLYAQHRGFMGAIDPRLVDVGALTANAALLFALLRLSHFNRQSNEGAEEEA